MNEPTQPWICPFRTGERYLFFDESEDMAANPEVACVRADCQLWDPRGECCALRTLGMETRNISDALLKLAGDFDEWQSRTQRRAA